MNKVNDLENIPVENGFRLRGIEMSRLETFMDAAFAFTTTMLVISVGEIPKSFPELILALKEIPSFASSFFIIMLFWSSHRSWSRRYGLEDTVTILISTSLILVLLIYVYPLRLMFSALFAWISGGWLPSRFTIQTYDELIGLFIIYGMGLMAMAGLMALLYLRARFAKNPLKLNRVEILKTDLEIVSFVVVSGTGLVSVLFAWLVPAKINLLAGLFYVTLAVSIPVVESIYKRKVKKCLKNKSNGC
jgi:uncharacterized membrane protein